MSYSIDSEVRNIVRRGPFGIHKKEIVDPMHLTKLDEGQSLEIFNRGGERWGLASLMNDVLDVTPEGEVVVDMDNISGFQSHAEIPTSSGEVRKIWVGSLKTTGNLTIRTTDGRESVIFRKTE